MKENRIYKWDNVKCFLIFSVVIGHFSNEYIGDSQLMRMITLFIYSFHMPLFIFISGLLTRKLEAKDRFRWDKVIYFIMIGYLLKLVTYGIKTFYGYNPEFDFFGDNKLPWYMFAMAAFLVINYLLRKVDWRIVLPASLVIACLVGYVDQIGSFLYLSRIFVFFPFYYLGYILTSDQVIAFTDRVEVMLSSWMGMVLILYFSTVCIKETFPWMRIFTARRPYDEIAIEGCGFAHRLVFYGIALVMGIAIIPLIPERQNKLASKIGKNTLQIYAWHRSVLYIIAYSGLEAWIMDTFTKYWTIFMLLIAVVLTMILSFRVFSLPLEYLKKVEDKILIHVGGPRGRHRIS